MSAPCTVSYQYRPTSYSPYIVCSPHTWQEASLSSLIFCEHCLPFLLALSHSSLPIPSNVSTSRTLGSLSQAPQRVRRYTSLHMIGADIWCSWRLRGWTKSSGVSWPAWREGAGAGLYIIILVGLLMWSTWTGADINGGSVRQGNDSDGTFTAMTAKTNSVFMADLLNQENLLSCWTVVSSSPALWVTVQSTTQMISEAGLQWNLMNQRSFDRPDRRCLHLAPYPGQHSRQAHFISSLLHFK